MDTLRLSAVELAAAIREGQVSASEAVDHVLTRITEIDGQLKAFITVDEDGARRAAHIADRQLADGAALGPLHGVPFSVKDLLDTAGVRTTYGSRSLADNVPEADVVAVARLLDAGAILIGKTATPELAATLCTRSALNGITRNPWNLSRSPGGSSGGAGAAVSAGMAPIAVSTDGAGSARIPAAACGVLGLKPTLGRIPHETWPFHFANNSSVSLNARQVDDLAIMLEIMSGPHRLDPWSRRPSSPLGDWRGESATSTGPAGRVLFISHPAGSSTDSEVLASVEITLAEMEHAGYVVDRAAGDPTGFDVAMVSRISAPNLVARAHRLTSSQQALLEEPLQSLVNNDRYRPSAVNLQDTNLDRSRLYERVEELLDNYDLIVSPTVLAEPPLADRDEIVVVDGEEVPLLNWWAHLAVANMTGHPAISVPSGLTEAGLPVGIHALGRWDDEAALLRFAESIAKARPWQDLWPPATA